MKKLRNWMVHGTVLRMFESKIDSVGFTVLYGGLMRIRQDSGCPGYSIYGYGFWTQ
jgi:hypothetical protein